MEDAAAHAVALRPTPLQGVVTVLGVMAAVVGYVAIGSALGIVPLYAGFVFAFYWGAIAHCDLRALPAVVIGMLAGLACGAAIDILPTRLGGAGLAIGIGLAVIAIYLLVMKLVPMIVNNAFMLMLTIATIPPLAAVAPFVAMGCAIMLAAALMGGLIALAGAIASRRKRGA